jgi:beta-N-acetylhexosaminidase
LPRLVAASLLVVVLAAGCRTAIAPDAARLAALEPELGSLLLVGIDGIDGEATDVDRLLCGARVGGTVLFARNIVAPEQLARLTAALAERAAVCTGLKLLVAVDAEGGSVMRLGPSAGWPGTLSAQELGETNDFVLTELEARRIGRMLRAAGINWDLAPVVDVGLQPGESGDCRHRAKLRRQSPARRRARARLRPGHARRGRADRPEALPRPRLELRRFAQGLHRRHRHRVARGRAACPIARSSTRGWPTA